jgi:hypothetical protein
MDPLEDSPNPAAESSEEQAHRLQRQVELLRQCIWLLSRQVRELAQRDNAGAGR